LSTPIKPAVLAATEICDLAQRGELADTYGPLVMLEGALHGTQVDPAIHPTIHPTIDPAILGAEPCVVVGSDVLITSDSELSQIVATVEASPIAAVTVCVLLRSTVTMASIEGRLALESATYSTLQAGPEFARWRSQRESKAPATTGVNTDAVMVSRTASTLTITLNRPHHGNAVSRAVQDQLAEALRLVLLDDSIQHILLTGSGSHFCTGGDLNEFGSFSDPATSHLVRLQRSPARLLGLVRQSDVDITVRVHGASAGSGVEIAAFGSTVRAHRDATFWLPELSLGLVPGSGGSVSIVNRIGGQRTAWLLLTGNRIDAPTALAWGLVDVID
jgi:enoyl-CoA hydratase